MQIDDLLTLELVVPALEAAGQDEAIEALALHVATRCPDIDARQLANAVREREHQVTTALGDGVAIPHARLSGLGRVVVALARSRGGIAWDAPDGKPAYLLFLLVGPREAPGAYLKVLAAASRVLSDGPCRARLLAAEDESQLRGVFREEAARTRGVRAA